MNTTPATHRSPAEIMADLRTHWAKPYFGAVPYIEALECLTSWSDNYVCDSARSLGAYLLGNMSTFKGDDARRLKAELKEATK